MWLLRNLMPAMADFVTRSGFEPPSSTLTRWRSTVELPSVCRSRPNRTVSKGFGDPCACRYTMDLLEQGES